MNIHRFQASVLSIVFIALFLEGCSWQNETYQDAIYNCIFDCWTAGNVLNPDYNDTTGKKIEGYINYLPYFASSPKIMTWTFDYSRKATMKSVLLDGTIVTDSGTYYSATANSGEIIVTLDSGEKETLTWNDAFVDSSGNKSHGYFEFYTSRVYHIEQLGGDVTVWMLYHSRKIW
jgi:hypothetical protein